ncbi:MAG: TetR/AcrR family transcriptional regulator [Syntrophales bacterium]|nr:TetR/AcrR family transcriptional regulator [Syntrophales bacterium]
MAIQREHTDIRQRQIINAATNLICKYGSEHLTVKKIAAEVGISEAAIYCHFKSKKEILSFMLSHMEAILLHDISRDSIGSKAVTLESIDKVFRKHFSAIGKRKGISFQVIAEIISLGDWNLNRQAFQTIERYISCLKELLSEGIRNGVIRKDIDLDASATLLFTFIQGLLNIWALSEGRFNVIKKYDAIWKIYLGTIASL